MAERSSGHLAFDSKYEYLVYGGEVYRAPLDCPIRADVPIRNGARWFARSVEAAQRIFDSYPEHLRFPERSNQVNESEREKILDARIQRRLSTDTAYRYAENAEDQKRREEEIEEVEVARLDAETTTADFARVSFPGSVPETAPCEVCGDPVREGLRYMAGPLAGRVFCEAHDPLRGGPRQGFPV